MAVYIDSDLCRGCGICMDCCPENAIALETVAVVDPEKCTDCGTCVDTCPFGAIILREKIPVRNFPQSNTPKPSFPGRGFGRGMVRGQGRLSGRGYRIQGAGPVGKTTQDSLSALRSQTESLGEQLRTIQNRLEELKSKSQTSKKNI